MWGEGWEGLGGVGYPLSLLLPLLIHVPIIDRYKVIVIHTMNECHHVVINDIQSERVSK